MLACQLQCISALSIDVDIIAVMCFYLSLVQRSLPILHLYNADLKKELKSSFLFPQQNVGFYQLDKFFSRFLALTSTLFSL